MNAAEFLREKSRMCKFYEECDDGCPLVFFNFSCADMEETAKRADEVVKAVEKWSKEHPSKTYLSMLLDHFPNIVLDSDGTPEFCPSSLGFKNFKFCNDGDCRKCWNQPCE